MTVSTLMPVATWWTNQTRVPTQVSARTSAPVTPRCGTKATSSTERTVRSTTSAYAKVPRKMPRAIWLPRSRTKLRSRRGPIWPEASDRAATVIEKVVPATPIVEEATALSSARAPASPPL